MVDGMAPFRVSATGMPSAETTAHYIRNILETSCNAMNRAS